MRHSGWKPPIERLSLLIEREFIASSFEEALIKFEKNFTGEMIGDIYILGSVKFDLKNRSACFMIASIPVFDGANGSVTITP